MNYDDYGNESIIPNEMMKELIEEGKTFAELFLNYEQELGN